MAVAEAYNGGVEKVKRLEKRLVELEYRLHLRQAPGEIGARVETLDFRTDRVEPPEPRLAEAGVKIRVMNCKARRHNETGRSPLTARCR